MRCCRRRRAARHRLHACHAGQAVLRRAVGSASCIRRSCRARGGIAAGAAGAGVARLPPRRLSPPLASPILYTVIGRSSCCHARMASPAADRRQRVGERDTREQDASPPHARAARAARLNVAAGAGANALKRRGVHMCLHALQVPPSACRHGEGAARCARRLASVRPPSPLPS